MSPSRGGMFRLYYSWRGMLSFTEHPTKRSMCPESLTVEMVNNSKTILVSITNNGFYTRIMIFKNPQLMTMKVINTFDTSKRINSQRYLTFILAPFQNGWNMSTRIHRWFTILKLYSPIDSNRAIICFHATQISSGRVRRIGSLPVYPVRLQKKIFFGC